MIFTTTTGTFSFTFKPGGVICDILMIGGGGAGAECGGGGAGACIVAIGHTLPGGDYNVTVGAGAVSNGMGGISKSRNNLAYNGIDSSISVGGNTLYCAKGGGSGSSGSEGGGQENNGGPGGCGGGAGWGGVNTRSGGNFESTNIVNGTYTGPTIQPTYAVFGNKGGDQEDNGTTTSKYSCPGGGGIGAAGGNHVTGNNVGGPGGAGLNEATINNITYNFKSYFANNRTFGDISGYIGGGGSGIARYSTTQAPGGIGGGGKGFTNINTFIPIIPTPGATNTGSGGGGGDGDRVNGRGDSSGGSGIVIIRYRS
jgi:hypothetical protein